MTSSPSADDGNRVLSYRGAVGSDLGNGHSRRVRTVAAAAVAVLGFVGCASDTEPVRATVTPSTAYTAIVRWEVDRSEPVVDADGNIEAPVIYLASGSGETVDVRVQADVVSDIGDDAVIRFADDARDVRDDGLDDEPVKDDGVLILVDKLELDQPRVEARVVRYVSIDDETAWILDLVANDEGATIESATVVTE